MINSQQKIILAIALGTSLLLVGLGSVTWYHLNYPAERIHRQYGRLVIESDSNNNGAPDTWIEIIPTEKGDILAGFYEDKNEDGQIDYALEFVNHRAMQTDCSKISIEDLRRKQR